MARETTVRGTGTAPTTQAKGTAPTTRRKVYNPALSAKNGGNRERNALWYLNTTDPDLALVTDEATNEKLGIAAILAYEPSETLLEKRPDCVATVRVRLNLVSEAGLDLGCFGYKVVKSAFHTDEKPAYRLQGAGYMQGGTPDPANPQRRKGGQWFDYIRLPKAIRAQILRHVAANLVDLDVEPALETAADEQE